MPSKLWLRIGCVALPLAALATPAAIGAAACELGVYQRVIAACYPGRAEGMRVDRPQGELAEHDLEGQARRMVEHCGLEWEEVCLAFHKTRRSVQTASVAQVRQPIYRSSVGRWRPYKHLLQPLFRALDAEP